MVKNGVYDIKVGGYKRKFLHCPISKNFDFVHGVGHGRDLRMAMGHMTTGMPYSNPPSLSGRVKALIYHRGDIRASPAATRDYQIVYWVMDRSNMGNLPMDIQRVFESLTRGGSIRIPLGGVQEPTAQQLGVNFRYYLREVFQPKIEEVVNQVFCRYANQIIRDDGISRSNRSMTMGRWVSTPMSQRWDERMFREVRQESMLEKMMQHTNGSFP